MSRFQIVTLVGGAAMALALPSISNAQLFFEDFNDSMAGTRWSYAHQEEDGDPVLGEDGTVDYAFDYSSIGIANPNGQADTIGAFLQFNNTDDGAVNEGESYSIYPDGQSFSGDFRLDVDMFVYNDGAAGTTEHGMAGLFLDNADPVSPYEFGAAGGPLAWVYTGEGGDGAGDLGIFREGNASDTGYLALNDYNDIPEGTIPGFHTGDPGDPPSTATSLGPAAPPNDRGSWVEVSIRSLNDMVHWYLNGALVDTYDNSGGFYTSGNILLGGMDVFNSANSGNGVVVDNVVVTQIPEPTAAVLGLCGLLALAATRRRAR